jgi:hypothetical protein
MSHNKFSKPYALPAAQPPQPVPVAPVAPVALPREVPSTQPSLTVTAVHFVKAIQLGNKSYSKVTADDAVIRLGTVLVEITFKVGVTYLIPLSNVAYMECA